MARMNKLQPTKRTRARMANVLDRSGLASGRVMEIAGLVRSLETLMFGFPERRIV